MTGLPLLGSAGAGAALGLALGLGGWIAWDEWAAPMICEDLRGGRHGHQGCITPACHAAGDCGLQVSPPNLCPELRIGDPLETVIFALGEPLDRAANPLNWHSWKDVMDPGVIARIEGRRLVALDCAPQDGEGRPIPLRLPLPPPGPAGAR